MTNFYADQNISRYLTEQLRVLGHRVVTAYEEGRDAADDDDHLLFAADAVGFSYHTT